MNNKEEAEHLWKEKSERDNLIGFSWSYIQGISDFKAALIQAVEKMDNPNFTQNDIIELINETKPL